LDEQPLFTARGRGGKLAEMARQPRLGLRDRRAARRGGL